MRTLPQLYQDIVKQIRVVRNVAKSHKESLNATIIVMDAMTAYERGRMCRATTKLSRDLYELYLDHGQTKMMTLFHAFIEGLGVSGGAFVKPGSGHWSTLYRISKDTVEKELAPQSIPVGLGHIGAMLDEPLRKVPGRVTLMKLSAL